MVTTITNLNSFYIIFKHLTILYNMIHTSRRLETLIKYKNMLVNNIANLKYTNSDKTKILDCEKHLKQIREYIKINCQHDIEIDYIDSMRNGDYHTELIRYCTKCKLTL